MDSVRGSGPTKEEKAVYEKGGSALSLGSGSTVYRARLGLRVSMGPVM